MPLKTHMPEFIIARVRATHIAAPFSIPIDSRSVYHLQKNPGNSGWAVNGTRHFGSSHRKISEMNGTSKKVVPFSRSGIPNGNLCSI